MTGGVGTDALHKAVQAGNINGLEAALESGLDANARDGRGWTALMHAAEKGYVLMVGPLLKSKADPDVRAVNGATALFMAAGHGYTEIIELLMKAGADPMIRSANGETPVEVARRKYVSVEAAREKGASPALLALLAGKTWAQIMAQKDDAAIARARSKGTVEAYDEYLSSFRQGRHREEALRFKAQKDDAAIARARSKGTVEAYDEYLSSFRQGRHREEALRFKAQKADDAAIARARSKGTIEAYDEYLSSFRQGRHREEALRFKAQKADDAAIARARSKGTIEAYDEYLSSFRQGRHREEVLRLKAKAQAEALKRRWPAGKKIQDCPYCPEMVVVPAGSFMMGSPPDETDKDVRESPHHQVMIPKPLAVGKYEVTFAEWDACVSDGGCGGHRPHDESWGRGRRPAINVSWKDAQEYVRWLSQKTNRQYRLLSEAEWEYAARAKTETPFHFGKEISPFQANYDGNYTYGKGAEGMFHEKTVVVGSFQANPFGLYDVHGNVWEWVDDCWHKSYAGAPSDGSAWTGGDCSHRVLRGGSWNDTPKDLRSAYRDRSTTGDRDFIIGFRVARTLGP